MRMLIFLGNRKLAKSAFYCMEVLMERLKFMRDYFSRFEIFLWCSSVLLIVISFAVFDRENYMTLIASVIGTTSLIFNAKGNTVGQVLMVIFSIFYGIISYTFSYYGEMITYLGMTAPMAIFALISWLLNPYNGRLLPNTHPHTVSGAAALQTIPFPNAPDRREVRTPSSLCCCLPGC